MSATIGAALKKIAVALLTDKKVIKTVGGIVIGIIIIVVMLECYPLSTVDKLTKI